MKNLYRIITQGGGDESRTLVEADHYQREGAHFIFYGDTAATTWVASFLASSIARIETYTPTDTYEPNL